jgi:hypothetical protein
MRISSSIIDQCDRKSVVGKACLKLYYSIALISDTFHLLFKSRAHCKTQISHGKLLPLFFKFTLTKESKGKPSSECFMVYNLYVDIKSRINMTSYV